MQTIKLKEKSKEELVKKTKQLKFYNTLAITAGFAVLVAGVYDIIVNKRFNPIPMVAFLLGFVIKANAKTLKMIEQELQTR